MTRGDWLRLGSLFAIIIAGIVLITFPLRPLKDVVKLGLDLQGGVRLVLEGEGVAAMTTEQQTETINRAIEILKNRVDSYGLANAEIRRYGEGPRQRPGAADPGSPAVHRADGRLGFRRVAGWDSASDSLSPTSSSQEVFYTKPGVLVLVDRGTDWCACRRTLVTEAPCSGVDRLADVQPRGAEQFARRARSRAGQLLATCSTCHSDNPCSRRASAAPARAVARARATPARR
jgi:preprotein translocase subunit SecD